VALTFSSPYSEELENRTNHELKSLVASTNLLWGIQSFSGALALQSYRKPMTNEVVTQEIMGGVDDRPGARLMDILSIRWISKSIPRSTTSRHLVPVRNAEGKSIVLENRYALPVIQTYPDAQFVSDAEEALRALQADRPLSLYVEANPAEFAHSSPAPATGQISLRRIRFSPTRYRFVSNSEYGYWLFIADTWYPGWQASIDDKPAKLYPAQVLGKALFVPAGEHGIKVYFQSDSFRLGALVSGLTVFCLLLYGARAAWRRHRGMRMESRATKTMTVNNEAA
jgi:hypothetical protein